MQNITISIFACALLLANFASHSQGVLNPKSDTVKWTYRQVENRVKSETVSVSGHFLSYGGKNFLWVQDEVDRQYAFKSRSVSGNWTNASRAGEMIYRVTCNGEEGTLKLVRNGTKIFVELNFLQPNKSTPHLLLLITSISKV